MEVSWNGVGPKSSIHRWYLPLKETIINHAFYGGTSIYSMGNHHFNIGFSICKASSYWGIPMIPHYGSSSTYWVQLPPGSWSLATYCWKWRESPAWTLCCSAQAERMYLFKTHGTEVLEIYIYIYTYIEVYFKSPSRWVIFVSSSTGWWFQRFFFIYFPWQIWDVIPFPLTKSITMIHPLWDVGW